MSAYSENEVRELTRLFKQFMPVRNIAKILNRSESSVIQKYQSLGLHRDFHVTKMVQKHGLGILKHGRTSKTIKKALVRIHKKEITDRAKSRAMIRRNGLKILKQILEDKVDRNLAIRAAFNAGATLKGIGEVVGMTKQGVSLIVKQGPNYEK